MFLDTWMIIAMGIWWLASMLHIARSSRIQGIAAGLEYSLDVLGYKGNEKKAAIDRIKASLNNDK